jgi:hypothetical protein
MWWLSVGDVVVQEEEGGVGSVGDVAAQYWVIFVAQWRDVVAVSSKRPTP